MMRLRLSLLCFLSMLTACDCSSGPTPVEGCTTSSDCAAGQSCVDSMCVATPDSSVMDADVGMDADLPECTSDGDCGGGVCLDGACCVSSDSVCGGSCCASAETCFAGSCVTPGAECTSRVECEAAEYCEPALGDDPLPDGGIGSCSATPPTGRCLALPPTCDMAAPGEACIRTECEFRPEVGDLDAVVQWRWGPDEVVEEPTRVDVWSTPMVGRLYDTNCDGTIDARDPSTIVFVSNDTGSGACHSGDNCRNAILRALNGSTGEELWSLASVPSSLGFAGVALALGDLDDDGRMDIVAMTAEGNLAAISGDGVVMGVGTDVLPYATLSGLGWGGGLALADMDGNGDPEVAWRGAVYTWAGGTFTEVFNVASARGGWAHGTVSTSTSYFVNLDGDPQLELLAGRTAIDTDGTILWQRTDIADGFAAVGDFNLDGAPEVVLIYSGNAAVLDPGTGATLIGPFDLPGTGQGGPPTIADFDGDGSPEIGVAMAQSYSMIEVDFGASSMSAAWSSTNHDNSSSVTGSTVFDFEGDGIAEVIYNDECYMWVYDGPTGNVRFSAPTNSFTGTEASLVADVDGDGHAEMVMVSTGANPTSWHCDHHTMVSATYPAWEPPTYGPSWRGISVFRDAANGWVGTRSLWTQHAYHVTNTCDDRDSACDPARGYGAIPERQQENWSVPWLNNFRQNVQDEGIFDAPDATVTLRAVCSMPVTLVASVQNLGRAVLPTGVVVGFYQREGGVDTMLGTDMTTGALFPGQAAEVSFEAPAGVPVTGTFVAKIEIDAAMPTFRECDGSNNESDEVTPFCLE
ncbi:MAG: VCBS repeat-containing protein [Deltaproteobacteria bacterium]|nr:VCBS repeat-containing protein [Deltaproteobacteria bacterium]